MHENEMKLSKLKRPILESISHTEIYNIRNLHYKIFVCDISQKQGSGTESRLHAKIDARKM